MNKCHAQSETFPLPFPYVRILDQQTDNLGSAPFIVSAMFTEGYSNYTERLVESCNRHRLSYVLYEVPTVHQSISPKGTADLSFTKANFISHLLEKYRIPVLYVDVDCFISEYPVKLVEFARDGYDFAIYNWLAEEHTESYVPVEIKINVGNELQTFKNRFYRFSHSIDYFTTEQLICSGAVQFYNNTGGAKELLRQWHEVIVKYPNATDDKCLDYAFNNLDFRDRQIKAAWLPKSYARYAWWIYERPVINHPDIPYSGTGYQPIPEHESDKRRFYPEKAQKRVVDYYFPRDCLIDTEKKWLVKVKDGWLHPWRPLNKQLWL